MGKKKIEDAILVGRCIVMNGIDTNVQYLGTRPDDEGKG